MKLLSYCGKLAFYVPRLGGGGSGLSRGGSGLSNGGRGGKAGVVGAAKKAPTEQFYLKRLCENTHGMFSKDL